MEKQQAAGSIWNVNSWHWQMKNYTKPAQQILERHLLDLVLQPSPDLKIVHKKVKFTKSECEINVRKGKQYLIYDFQLQLDVEAHHESEDNAEGSYKVKEILSDDLNDMVLQDIKATEKNKSAQLLKKQIKKNAKQHIVKIFKSLQEELAKSESDPKKLEEDRKKREEMLAATQKAREETGAQKERLLQQQKAKERKLKEQAMIKNYEQAIKKTQE